MATDICLRSTRALTFIESRSQWLNEICCPVNVNSSLGSQYLTLWFGHGGRPRGKNSRVHWQKGELRNQLASWYLSKEAHENALSGKELTWPTHSLQTPSLVLEWKKERKKKRKKKRKPYNKSWINQVLYCEESQNKRLLKRWNSENLPLIKEGKRSEKSKRRELYRHDIHRLK